MNINWRKLNNILHRDVGYYFFGMTTIYALSGIALNHIADWDPNYIIENKKLQADPSILSNTMNKAQVQDLKEQILELNKDLFILEEELLYPSNTQLAVFLSLDIGSFFALDAVKLTLDGELVSNYLYTDRQLDALARGGVQRLFIGNLKKGKHELVAVFTGRGPQGRDYRRATSVTFEKTSDAKYIELKITDQTANNQPEFVAKQW